MSKRKRDEMELAPPEDKSPKPKPRKKRAKTGNAPEIESPSLAFKKGTTMKKKNVKGSLWPRLPKMLKLEGYDQYPPSIPTYTSIAAPPSVQPHRKYCDITGYEAHYTDPKTGLRYHNAEAFQFIRNSLNSHEKVQEYLALRNAHTVIK